MKNPSYLSVHVSIVLLLFIAKIERMTSSDVVNSVAIYICHLILKFMPHAHCALEIISHNLKGNNFRI